MSLEALGAQRVPMLRRKEIEAAVRGPHSLTDVKLIEDIGLQIEVREALTGFRRQGRVPVHKIEWQPIRTYRFRTVDGRPLGPFKVGPVEGTTRQLHQLAVRGLPLDEEIEFPGAEFEVPAYVGLMMLDRIGWGLVHPRFAMRNAAQLGEKDAYGRPVKPRDRWLVVEVGSVMEARAREAGDLKPIGGAPKPEPPPPPEPETERGPSAAEEVAETLAAKAEVEEPPAPSSEAEEPPTSRGAPKRGRGKE